MRREIIHEPRLNIHIPPSHQLQLQLQSRPGTPRVPAAPRARRQGLVSPPVSAPTPSPALPAPVAVVTVVAPQRHGSAPRARRAGCRSSIRGRGSQLFGRGWRCPTHPAGTPPRGKCPSAPWAGLPRNLRGRGARSKRSGRAGGSREAAVRGAGIGSPAGAGPGRPPKAAEPPQTMSR